MKYSLKNKNEQKGITLIALVTTIIVILILAGISITVLTGDNGVLNNASEAKLNTEEARIEEKIRIAVLELDTEIHKNRVKYGHKYKPTNFIASRTDNGITFDQTIIEFLQNRLDSSEGYTVAPDDSIASQDNSIKITFVNEYFNKEYRVKISNSRAKITSM